MYKVLQEKIWNEANHRESCVPERVLSTSHLLNKLIWLSLK